MGYELWAILLKSVGVRGGVVFPEQLKAMEGDILSPAESHGLGRESQISAGGCFCFAGKLSRFMRFGSRLFAGAAFDRPENPPVNQKPRSWWFRI